MCADDDDDDDDDGVFFARACALLFKFLGELEKNYYGKLFISLSEESGGWF
jgi:hypothetical protein